MPPRVLSDPPPAADHRLAYGGHPSQFVDFRLPACDGVRPLAIMIHGGFWRARYDLLNAGHLCAALAAAGYCVANIEYRRVGEAGGGWPGTLEDAKRAVSFPRQSAAAQRGDPSRTVLLGHSAGGHLALWLAGELPDLAAVVALAPVAGLRDAWERGLGNGAAAELMLGAPGEFPDRYAAADPAERPATVPRVLIHGELDDIVPIEVSREFSRRRASDVPPPKLIEVAGADHFAVIDPVDPAWAIVLEQVNHLGVTRKSSK
jgi:acetyl esterase/lipase